MTTASAGLQGDNIGFISSLFYASDSAIGSLDHEWLQKANHYLCILFKDCTGLKSNTEKTESVSCHPAVIQKRCSMEGYKRQHKGTGETYTKKKRGNRTERLVPFCGKETWPWKPYNLTYVRNIEWILLVKLSRN